MSKATRRQLAKEDFLGTLEHLADQIPLTAQEQATMLPPADVVAASLKKLMQTVEQEQARRAQVRLDAGRAGRAGRSSLPQPHTTPASSDSEPKRCSPLCWRARSRSSPARQREQGHLV